MLDMDFFVDRNFSSWYERGLPTGLARDVELLARSKGRRRAAGPWTLADFDGLEVPNFVECLTESLMLCHDPRLPYHGIDHGQRVTDRGYDGLLAWQELSGEVVPEGLVQPVVLGFSQHDRSHPGATFFADAAPEMVPAGADADMSVEWWSAELFDDFAVKAGLSVEQRLVGVYTIWSSTYGIGTPHGVRLRLERIRPQGFIGRLMHAVDVAGADDFVTSVHADVNVSYGERPARPAPRSWPEYWTAREGFLCYVEACYDELDAAAGCALTEFVGWRSALARRRRELAVLRTEQSPVKLAVLRSQLAVSGVSLAF